MRIVTRETLCGDMAPGTAANVRTSPRSKGAPVGKERENVMGPGTSSDVLVIFYIVIAATLAFVAAGFAMRRKGHLRDRRTALVFAILCVSPILIGTAWYVWTVPK
jgi:hypothetical protein